MSDCATVTAIRTGRTTTELDAGVQYLTLAERVEEHGLCSGTPNDTVWFPNKTITPDMARQACAGCPVVAECLELALREEANTLGGSWGIFGAATPDERRELIARQAVA